MTTTAAGDAAVARLNKATEAFEKIITGTSNQVVDVPGYGNQPTLAARVDERLDEITASAAAEADRSRDEADRSTIQATAAANSVTLANAEFNKANTQADRAQYEADRAAQITGLSTVADAIGMAALPLPDVWAPLSDSLRLITGYGRDVLVGSDVVARMVNFSRNSTATYIGKDGLLKTAAANEPRFEKEGLLIEGQSTNLTQRSEDWDFFSHVTGGATVKTATEQNPYGASSQIKSAVCAIANSNVSLVGAPYDMSAVKSLSVFFNIKTAPSGFSVYVTSASDKVTISPAGEISSVASVLTATAKPVGGAGWRRLTISTGIAVNRFSFNLPNVGDEIAFWGVQTESLPFASSYIPTTGAAVTRAADIVTIPWAMNINPSAVTVAMNYDLAGNGQLQRLIEYAPAVNPRYLVQMSSTGYMESFSGAVAAAVPSAPYGAGSTMVAATSKTRHAFKLSGKALSSVTPDGPVSPAPIVSVGAGISGGAPIYGHVRNLRIWHRTLTDDQLKAVA